jgi:hypothetical protein
MLAIHGKGKKDRVLPIPKTITEALMAQIGVVTELHEKDLAAGGYDGVFLDDAVDKRRTSGYRECVSLCMFIW